MLRIDTEAARELAEWESGRGQAAYLAAITFGLATLFGFGVGVLIVGPPLLDLFVPW